MIHETMQFPEPGFYYHYKHDPAGAVSNYAYYIYGAGHHTEDDCRDEDQYMLVYRPLYRDAFVYRKGKLFDLRPLGMFFEPARVGGRNVPRFEKITDPAVVSELTKIMREMYEEHPQMEDRT